jgi:hypothetical protein
MFSSCYPTFRTQFTNDSFSSICSSYKTLFPYPSPTYIIFLHPLHCSLYLPFHTQYLFLSSPSKSCISYRTVLRIRDVYRIPDPNIFHLGSRICIKEFKFFNTKICFLSSGKYDPGCWILIFYPSGSRIQDPGVKRHQIPEP